ncbi:MAG TPA: hypothetical protein VFC56_14040 [Stellaceae bacterium]|nr:hypothetical protein [Stellaceae bacterium]
MKSSRHEILHRHGYVALTEMRELMVRLCQRMEELDEPMTREYVLGAHSGGIEGQIKLMCQRRKVLLTRMAEAELGRIASDTETPPPTARGRRR